jgi:hypothetical protein
MALEIKYPETILRKSNGLTESEKFLSQLCKHSFLSLWSFPNTYKNDGMSNGKGDGQELCDLLIVFGNHILIFSDKDCAYPQSENSYLNWSRWYRRAIKKNAEQIWMAEKWLLNFPNRIFLDKKCITPFPLEIPNKKNAIIHRIVVAHSGSNECSKQLGGSGSLMIVPAIIGDQHMAPVGGKCQPFAIGQINPKKGYVHVFDDTSLKIIMSTLDTISDFVEYLLKKEKFILSNRLGFASGEDDLLAYYLHDVGPDDHHDFILEENVNILSINEGLWKSFSKSPQRMRQIEANRISYSWDHLIEEFLGHIVNGTSYYISHPNLKDQDTIFRILAKENRTRRRLLADALISGIADTSKDGKLTRTICPSNPGDPYYVFLLVSRPSNVDFEEFRNIRLGILQKYCLITKLRYPEAKDIVGIATEPGLDSDLKSEDCIYFNGNLWDDSTKKEAEEFQAELQKAGLLKKRKMFYDNIKEYPDSIPEKDSQIISKSQGRNDRCSCGSGLKFKKCHGKLK